MFKEKYAQGKELRSKVSRTSQASWQPATDRPSVEQMIQLSNYDRLPDLVPIRHFRMSGSPFVFYRATASLMARDLSITPSSGIIVQACGDCHLANFGGFATPERHLVIDINDFDETHPAPWEWDVKRLATSFILAGRDKSFREKDCLDIAGEMISSYQDSINEFANMNFLDLWYMKFDLEELHRKSKSERVKERLSKVMQKAHQQTVDQVFYKLTSDNLGKFLINEQLPLVYHPFNLEESMDMINKFMEGYKNTLQPDRKLFIDRYKVVDVALKVVGVGSVGTRCFVALMINDDNEPIFLQVKEARQSVLEPFTNPNPYGHQGERVVQGQRLIQSASDMFLGWSMGPGGRHFYLRQLRDKKISANLETMDKFLLSVYARLCGRVLARAHCKTGQGAYICGFIGKGEVFQEAICKFSLAYADQTEKDYEEFMQAVKLGKLAMQPDK